MSPGISKRFRKLVLLGNQIGTSLVSQTSAPLFELNSLARIVA